MNSDKEVARPQSSVYAAPWTSYRLVGALFVTLCLFPWVSFGLLDMDTQPWFILAAILLCALSIRVKADALVLGCALSFTMAAVLSGVVRMEVAADVLLIRGVLSYAAFSGVLLGYYYYRKKFGFPLGIFVGANLIWLLAGVIQLALDPTVLEAVVVVRTAAGRGVTGLAPEPTYYGMVLLFLSWILLVEHGYRLSAKLWLLVALNLVFILLIAKSAMALVFVFILLTTYLLFGVARLSRFIYVAALLAVVIGALLILKDHFPEWRILRVVMALAEDPLLAVRADASMNQRFGHLAFSLYGALTNAGFPGGFNSFADASAEARAAYGGLFWFGGDDENKIMSGVGAVVYELGWLSLIFFVLVAFCTLSRRQLRLGTFHLVGFLAVFAAALPIAFPLAPILLVTMLFWRRGKPGTFVPWGRAQTPQWTARPNAST